MPVKLHPRPGKGRGPGTLLKGLRQPRFSAYLFKSIQLLQDLVGGGDDAGEGPEAALGDDQVGEPLGQVHVAYLQGACADAVELPRAQHCSRKYTLTSATYS